MQYGIAEKSCYEHNLFYPSVHGTESAAIRCSSYFELMFVCIIVFGVKSNIKLWAFD
jgi:hypothetical protein